MYHLLPQYFLFEPGSDAPEWFILRGDAQK
jgi:hypothetical protein